ncbi:ROK family transcriptional regulator [Micrococcales bacterium 31B]|nr:ROK family transcriptional regulator [Micrococcales bacterium 31B]
MPEPKGGQRHASMRTNNQALVLANIRESGHLTKAQLAQRTGLAKSGISNILEDLFAASLIEATESLADNPRGRPGQPLRVSQRGPVGIGIEVNVDYVSAAAVSLRGDVVATRSTRRDLRDLDPREVCEAALELAEACAREAAAVGYRAAGCTIALPGSVAPDRLRVHHLPNLGWRDVDLAAPVAVTLDTLDLPLGVRIENEANCAALAERWYGQCFDIDDFIHVTGEIGIGAGLIQGGALFRGAGGNAGEIGHFVVDPNGPDCTCGGRGCLERYVGLGALAEAVGTLPDAEALLVRLRAGYGLPALATAATHLGVALASISSLVDPTRIVLGGHLAELYDLLYPHLWDAFTRHAPHARVVTQARGGVRSSNLGQAAAVRGAAGLVCENIYTDPASYVARLEPAHA